MTLFRFTVSVERDVRGEWIMRELHIGGDPLATYPTGRPDLAKTALPDAVAAAIFVLRHIDWSGWDSRTMPDVIVKSDPRPDWSRFGLVDKTDDEPERR